MAKYLCLLEKKYIKLFFAFTWLILLMDTEAYFSIYTLIALISVVGFYKIPDRINESSAWITAMIISLCTILANYTLFEHKLWGGITFLLGVVVYKFAICNLYSLVKRTTEGKMAQESNYKKLTVGKIFLLLFVIYGIYFLSNFPGNLDTDSFNVIKQIVTGQYEDHHPICFTMLVQVFIEIGRLFSRDINIGVGLYAFFQLIVVAGVYAYIISTVDAIAGRKIAITFLVWYILHPVHMTYAVTVWKDVLSGIMSALWMCAFLKIQHKIGNYYLNTLWLLIGGIGFCVFRHNGKIAFVVLTVIITVITIVSSKMARTVAVCTIVALAVSLSLNAFFGEITNAVEVPSVDSMSIPLQQISRVVVDNRELTEDERTAINDFIDIEVIPNIYVDYVSDPIKGELYKNGNKDYFSSNSLEFVKLWVRLGIKYPGEYLKAWVDMTGGYWNAGYSYFKWINYVKDNELGIVRKNIPVISNVYDKVFQFVANSRVLQPLIGIGIHTWVFLAAFVLNLLKKNLNGIIMLLPVFLMIGTVLIATPLDCELRYVWILFTAFPLVVTEMAECAHGRKTDES